MELCKEAIYPRGGGHGAGRIEMVLSGFTLKGTAELVPPALSGAEGSEVEGAVPTVCKGKNGL